MWQKLLIAAVAFVVPAGAGEMASSEWGAGYGAAQAADGASDENDNYWQTVQNRDKGAWWQQDLGRPFPVKAVRIVWARYQDKVHCPPARAVIQTSLTGEEGSWKDALAIGPADLPRDGQPYDAERQWRYALPDGVSARFVRILFPDGSQPGAKYPGYLCLGEVEIEAPGRSPQIVALEGAFGKAEVNTTAPALVRLYLRGPKGLTAQSLLARSAMRPWARGGYSYVVAQDGRRYESRLTAPDKAELDRAVLRISGVKLSAAGDAEPVATEDWTLSAPGDGAELVWTISRRWQRDATFVLSGSPALFFGFDARRWKNSVTSTLWHDPLRLAARPSGLYALEPAPGRVSDNHLVTVRDRDTWAVLKLWTTWQAPVDLRLEVRGGHLYRRGSFARLSEAGACTGVASSETRRKGQSEEIELRIRAADKLTTGYQLAVSLPDVAAEAALKDFYASVLNGGAVNDQKGFDFGNESDGWYYAGSSWMYGLALAAGTPAAGKPSSHPYDAASAFREHLAHILSVVDKEGRAHFGYNQGGEWVDDNLHTIIGARAYLLHSGDLPFVRQALPTLERMLGYFARRRNDRGLFRLDATGAHWYYDAITTSGVNGYYNAFFYKAACDLAEMEAAAGRDDKARECRDLAASLKAAFNAVLWRDDLPGGPRYLDWIDAGGKEVAYFCDLCQWPPIAVGIASPEQARKIVATADARIAQLEKDHGYQGFAGLSALWPVPAHLNPHRWQAFGTYMNGGSLLCQTYWEVVARARAGDADGAWRRLRLFAQRAAQTGWAGDNAANIKGEMQSGDGEPYLADMAVVPAAAVHGILGIEPTWDRLEVTPHLPAAWPRAEAEVLYKGRRHRVTIEGGKPRVEPLGQPVAPPLLWVMDFNLRASFGAAATATGIDFLGPYGSSVVLKPTAPSGTYQSPICDWTVPAAPTQLTVAADLNGGRTTAIVETSNDDFKTTEGRTQLDIRDGVNAYPLDAQLKVGRLVRIRFDLSRGKEGAASPVLDAFRLAAKPALP